MAELIFSELSETNPMYKMIHDDDDYVVVNRNKWIVNNKSYYTTKYVWNGFKLQRVFWNIRYALHDVTPYCAMWPQFSRYNMVTRQSSALVPKKSVLSTKRGNKYKSQRYTGVYLQNNGLWCARLSVPKRLYYSPEEEILVCSDVYTEKEAAIRRDGVMIRRNKRPDVILETNFYWDDKGNMVTL